MYSLSLFLAGGALISYVGIRDDIFELNALLSFIQLIAKGLFVVVDDLVVRTVWLGVYDLPSGFDYLFTFFIEFCDKFLIFVMELMDWRL